MANRTGTSARLATEGGYSVFLLYGHTPNWGGQHILIDVFSSEELALSYAQKMIEMGLLPDDENAWSVEARTVRDCWWVADS